MSRPRILLQLDPDPQPSVFDAVVAIDAGVEHLLRHGGVTRDTVRDLVYGCIFTRGLKDLAGTAIFVGGTNVDAGQELLESIKKTFFGPLRVSVMLDANGANTTAAAAVLAAGSHVQLSGSEVLVLAATGPVGQRVVRLLAREGARVRVASRSAQRSARVCQAVQAACGSARLSPWEVNSASALTTALEGVSAVVAAGAAGVELLSEPQRLAASALRVAIDLNAVPPLGIAGIAAHDRGTDHQGVACYGALGVGATKMKIHKAAIAELFMANDLVLDAEEIYALGCRLTAAS